MIAVVAARDGIIGMRRAIFVVSSPVEVTCSVKMLVKVMFNKL